jgi:hypothetical protein
MAVVGEGADAALAAAPIVVRIAIAQAEIAVSGGKKAFSRRAFVRDTRR